MAAIVFVMPGPPTQKWESVAMLVLVVALGFLMVSTFRYRSFKSFDLRRRRSYMVVLGVAMLFLLIAAHPEASLIAATSLYTVSGPLTWVAGLGRRREPPAPVAAQEPQPAP